MSDQLPRFKVYPYSLPIGGSIPIGGFYADYIVCLKASERFLITFNGDLTIPLEQGLSYSLPAGYAAKIVTIQLETTSGATAAPNEIEIGLGQGELRDLRFNSTAPLSIASGTVIRSEVAQTLESVADVALVADTNTQVAAAESKRATVTVYNQSTTIPVRIATATADLGATQGYVIQPGARAELPVYGDIYARAIGGAATVTVSRTLFA